MRSLVLCGALAMVLAPGLMQPSADFDPVGKWTYSTHDEAGAPLSGTMEIAGKRGAYNGTISSSPDRTLQISDVFTSPTGMIVIANLPDGGVAVIKVWNGADGKLQAGWGPIQSVIPATIERAK